MSQTARGRDGTPAAHPDCLEANPLSMLSKLQGQEARHPQIVKMLRDALQHGRLAAAGGTGKENMQPVCLRWLSNQPFDFATAPRTHASLISPL